MERWSESQIGPPPDWDDEPTFKVVILYEDDPTGRRAKSFYHKIIQELVDECALNLELCNFQVLGIPEFGDLAFHLKEDVQSNEGIRGLPDFVHPLLKTLFSQVERISSRVKERLKKRRAKRDVSL
jgi:hypothetical protein